MFAKMLTKITKNTQLLCPRSTAVDKNAIDAEKVAASTSNGT
jgi:hypothetical protein